MRSWIVYSVRAKLEASARILSLLVILLAGACVLLCASCRQAQNTLYVFNWADYIGKTTIETFEKSTGLKVKYDIFSSNEDLMAKLATGGAPYDVIFPSGYAVDILMKKNALAVIDHSKIPNLTNLMQEFASPGFDKKLEYCVPYTWLTTGIGYDSTEISEAEVKSMSCVFDPKYRGKILMLDDMRASLGMALKSLGFSANSTDPGEIAKAKKRLLDQKPLVHVYTGANIPQLLASGEVKLAYAWSGDILQASRRNKNIRYFIPKEGGLLYVDYMCIPKASRHQDWACQFINHMLKPEVAAEISETINYALTNEKARQLVSQDTKKLWEVMDQVGDKPKFEFIQNLGSALQLYDQAWQEVKAGK